jgi:hypothetical protein
LAQAINSILDHPEKFRHTENTLSRLYAPEVAASEYEKLFEELSKTV